MNCQSRDRGVSRETYIYAKNARTPRELTLLLYMKIYILTKNMKLKKQRKYLAHCDIQLILNFELLNCVCKLITCAVNYMCTLILHTGIMRISVSTKSESLIEKVECQDLVNSFAVSFQLRKYVDELWVANKIEIWENLNFENQASKFSTKIREESISPRCLCRKTGLRLISWQTNARGP